MIHAWIFIMDELDLTGNHRPYKPHAESTSEIGDTSQQVSRGDEFTFCLFIIEENTSQTNHG